MSKKQKKKRNKIFNSAKLESNSVPQMKHIAVKGYKPMDNRQVTHNLRRRMGR